jgi:acylphosphatase
MAKSKPSLRVHMVISGDVQGVGFRAWTKKEAQKRNVCGWVKNREDGCVEVLAEGDKALLEEFIGECRKGPMVASVEDIFLEWSMVTTELVEFKVVY